MFFAMKRDCVRHIIIMCMSCLLWCSCSQPQRQANNKSVFITDILLKTTPVKEQGESNSCWIYGVLAMLETDRLEQGDSIHLSPAYLERALLQQKAKEMYLGASPLCVNVSGMMPYAFRLMNQVGLLSYDSYHVDEGTNTPFLVKKIALMAQQGAAQKQGFAHLEERVDNLLDSEMGALPTWVFLYGMQYSPKQFANSIYKPNEYQAYTSFTHHPFNSSFALEVPDNTERSEFINVPLDSLMHLIDQSLLNHRAVCWEGSLNKGEFMYHKGVARLPQHHTAVNQNERQKAFERLSTTDQHVMCIVGKAHSLKGKTYYIAKNSWGTNNPYHGFMYLSADYIKLRTIAIMCAKQN